MAQKILLVDDDLGAIRTISKMLAGLAEVQFATRGVDALRLIQESLPSVILLDAEMPGMSGFELCAAIKAKPEAADVPIIFVSSHGEVEFQVAGFEIGAADFIQKPVHPVLLQARVKTQLRLSQLSQELRRVAATDGLTLVANRRRFDELLQQEWRRGLRAGAPLSLLMIDVDHFKPFNDYYGHPAGDRCLQAVAGAIVQACRRPGDIAARYGGEEFALLMPNTDGVGAMHVVQRVMANVAALAIAHEASPTSPRLTVSVGIGVFAGTPDVPLGEAALVLAADQSLYAAKKAGRGQAYLLELDEFARAPDAGAMPPQLAVSRDGRAHFGGERPAASSPL